MPGARENRCIYNLKPPWSQQWALSLLSQAHPKSQTPPNTHSGFLSPKCSAQGPKFHLWIAGGAGGYPWGRAGIGNSAPHTKAARKNPLTSVYPICLCTGDSAVPICWQGYPGLPRTGSSQYVGGAAGVVLSGKEGWQLPNVSPVAWVESFPLCGTGAQHRSCPSWAPITSSYLDKKGMASQDPSPRSHGRLGPQCQAELSLPVPSSALSAGS